MSAFGRIGDGLSNRRDELYLIGPQGIDTLIHLSYNLSRNPNQSLVDQGRYIQSGQDVPPSLLELPARCCNPCVQTSTPYT